jgi:hypothetical protein
MKLNPLPRGVTGFSAPAPEALPAFDAAGFAAASYQVMRQLGGKVVSIDTDLIARNYFIAVLDLNGRRVAALCNTVFAYLAFVPDGETGFAKLRFLDETSLADAFRALPPFQPLTPGWLNERVSGKDLELLSDHEVEQARYWIKTGFDRIGELIFNCWD